MESKKLKKNTYVVKRNLNYGSDAKGKPKQVFKAGEKVVIASAKKAEFLKSINVI